MGKESDSNYVTTDFNMISQYENTIFSLNHVEATAKLMSNKAETTTIAKGEIRADGPAMSIWIALLNISLNLIPDILELCKAI